MRNSRPIQHEQHSDVAPSLDVMGIYECVTEEVGAHEHTGYDVTEHDGLFHQLEQQADDTRRNHQYIQIMYHINTRSFGV